MGVPGRSAHAGLTVVNRLEMIAAEQLRQFTSIDAVSLVALLEQSVFSRIADYQSGDMRSEQIV